MSRSSADQAIKAAQQRYGLVPEVRMARQLMARGKPEEALEALPRENQSLGDFGDIPNPRAKSAAKAKRAAKPRSAQHRFERLITTFEKLREAAAEKHAAMSRTSLKLDPGIHDTERHFAYTRGGVVHVAPELEDETMDVILGVLIHELGHVRQGMSKSRETNYEKIEREADRFAETLFGVKIYYDARGVETLREKGATRPRPIGLR